MTNNYKIKPSIEPEERYEKALKMLLEADKAIQCLTAQEQEKLALEFAQYKGIHGICLMIQKQGD